MTDTEEKINNPNTENDVQNLENYLRDILALVYLKIFILFNYNILDS